jgi:sarcosine oxidase
VTFLERTPVRKVVPFSERVEVHTDEGVYDLTADRNFILDTVPGQPRIGLFVGAGHAAKFAGLIGHILADLAVDGTTSYPIAAFSMDRPAVRDPDYPSDFRFTRAAQAATAEGSKP